MPFFVRCTRCKEMFDIEIDAFCPFCGEPYHDGEPPEPEQDPDE